jgi:hypothetical protein
MPQAINPFRSALNKTNLITAASTTVVSTQYTELGRTVVQAGVALAVGYEQMGGQDSATGRIFADFRDAAASPGALVDGIIRLDIHNAQDRVEATIWEGRTEALRQVTNDRGTWIPLPFINAVMKEDTALVLKFKADSASVVLGKTNTGLVIDTTVFDWK